MKNNFALSLYILQKIDEIIESITPQLFDEYKPILKNGKIDCKDYLNIDHIDEYIMILKTYSDRGAKDEQAMDRLKSLLDNKEVEYKILSERGLRVNTESFVKKMFD